ncbi:Cell wall assembly regulator SMI1 [Micromonospora siamensis]|uniref:Cell wall assembly regulator SMI1 n=1 Tax=Micromonospora siamensis TaxID=299152 RepID=A0A1C5JA96_9ACTN|nr:Cell wall assembly regulator SMI1 [Micromonospora siamensis]
MTEAWFRIESWVEKYAPKSLSALGPPADPSAIHAGEAQLGLTFPPQSVESLRRHDGLTRWAMILPEAPPLGVSGIVEQHQDRMDIAEDVDGFASHAPGVEPWWHERWLPFGASDGGLQVIDRRAGPGHGRLGWAPHDNPGDFSEPWPTLCAYLTQVADALGVRGEVHPSW